MTYRVLVVDDLEENVDILVNALGDFYDVSVAVDGMEALTSVSREKPDLILLDILMPNMDGYGVCRSLGADPGTAGVPIMLLSAVSDEEISACAPDLKIVDRIPKPMDIQDIRNRVKHFFQKRDAMTNTGERRMRQRTKGSVMVVDDVESEVDILVDTLGKDYEIYAATDGESALELASRVLPDLILLDVLMPGMDGYEVCRRLKQNPKTRDIPIIFVTVLGEEGHEATGLSLGALDYISKPFNRDIITARVRNHMALIEALRLREEVNRMMQHDMRNALSRIIGYPEILMLEGNLTPKQQMTLEKIQSAGYTLLNMINLGIQMYKMECGNYDYRPIQVDIMPVLHHVLEDVGARRMDKPVEFRVTISGVPPAPGDRFEIRCEALLVFSMLSNLILNAAEASGATGVVSIDMRTEEDKAIIAIHNAESVPEDIRNRFFEKYATSGKIKGTGIGTYSAMLMAETHGGTIHMQTSETEGTTVRVCFPL